MANLCRDYVAITFYWSSMVFSVSDHDLYE